MLHTSAEILDAPGQPREFLPAIDLRLQLPLLLSEPLTAALQVLPAAAILVERDPESLQNMPERRESAYSAPALSVSTLCLPGSGLPLLQA